ncbi:MAG: hypothetical protein IPN45_08555 [Actinomycetales bacterium]|nr:hypothetical protein [Actinomycetales bacterium]
MGLRIALRMCDKVDSLDVIDTPDAAALPASARGRAIITSLARGSLTVQTAYSDASVRDSAMPAEATTAPRSLTATLLKHETGVLLGRLDPGAGTPSSACAATHH